jgi:hypothetical protein
MIPWELAPWAIEEWLLSEWTLTQWGDEAGGNGIVIPAAGTVSNPIVAGFASDALAGDVYLPFRANLLDEPAAIVSGSMLLYLAIGNAAGSHWYNDRTGYQNPQRCVGDFDIAMELQVRNLDGSGLPPATGDARLAGLQARDPLDATGLRNYVHRMFGRAPGMEAPGDGIVDEDKSNVDSVSDWHTRAHPNPVTCRGWIRMRRVGAVFTSWVAATFGTWLSEVSVTRSDLPELLHVGPAIYSAAVDADVSAEIFQFLNLRSGADMSNTFVVQTDILEWAFEGTNMPAAPAARWLGVSTSTPTHASPVANFTEPSGNGYARQEITAAMGAISTGSGVRQIANDTDIEFDEATGSWGTITYIGVFSASSGGVPYRIAALDSSRTIDSGDILRFLAGEAVFTQG